MLMFGGGSADSALDDLWALELTGPLRWTRLEPSGPRPSGRYFPSMTYDAGRDRVLVFGGGRNGHSIPELWSLSLADLRWTLLPIGPYPLALERHGAVLDAARDRLLVYGGWEVDYDVLFSSYLVLSLELARPLRWRALLPSGLSPGGAIAASVVFDPRRDRLYTFGGGGFDYRNDSWSLDFAAGPAHSAWLLGALPARGRVELAWESSAGPGAAYDLERREAGADWTVVARLFVDGSSRLAHVDEGLRPGWRYSYRLRETGPVIDVGPVASAPMGEITVTIPGGATLDLLGARPNPASPGQIAIWYSLVDPAGATLELLDVRGRRVWHRDLSGTTAGPQVARPDVRLAAGLYFSRLRQGADAVTRKLLVVP